MDAVVPRRARLERRAVGHGHAREAPIYFVGIAVHCAVCSAIGRDRGTMMDNMFFVFTVDDDDHFVIVQKMGTAWHGRPRGAKESASADARIRVQHPELTAGDA